MDKNKMGEAIKAIAGSFTARNEAQANARISDAIDLLNKSDYKIKSAEDFDCFISNEVEDCLEAVARTIYDYANAKDKNKADFVFINYRFLESNIRELCTLREGICCCADKSRSIVEMYLRYVITGDIPDFDLSVEKYYLPKFGDYKMWMNFCEGLLRLHYGYPEEYFKAYKTLIDAEKRKYPHTLHRWHIRYKNGEDFEFTNSWDERTENPLKYDKEDDYYIINKKYVGSNEFEKYEPTDEEKSFFYKRHVCVPKDEVEIYSVDEEMMC